MTFETIRTMLIGYARVSTQEQTLDLQKDTLEKIGCIKIFSDVISGAKVRCPNRFLVVDRFLDSRCQSHLSYAWWRSILNEKRLI